MRSPNHRRLAGAAGLFVSLAVLPAEAAGARGGSVVIDRAGLVAYVADADNAALHRVDLLSFAVTTTPLACAPEQVAIVGEGRVAVSLRGCNRVEVLAVDASGEGSVVASAPVASEPFGLAVTPSGDVLVTSAWGHALSAFDGATLAPRFVIDLAAEPRGVAITADGARAFVTHGVGNAVTVVELGAEGPRAHRLAALGGRYRNRVDTAFSAGTLHPTASNAYAAVLSESGSRLFVPHLAVQNSAETTHTVPGAYGGVPVEEDTSVASVAVIGVRDETVLGAPDPRVKPSAAKVRIQADSSAMFAVAPGGSSSRQARAAAIVGDRLYVASYGTDELVELDARSLDPAMAPRRTFAVGQGPSGVDVDADLGIAVTWNQFSHDLSVVSLGSGAVETVPVAADPLPAALAAGRRLFHTERDRRISRDGRACAGCHPEGRQDGLTWKLGSGPRQTPMLVGRLETGPYGWLGKHPTLEGNMTETMARLGGGGLPAPRLAELAEYVRHGLRAPQRDAPSGADAAVATRGEALFRSQEVGCNGCHALDRTTSDGLAHNIASGTKTDETPAFRTPPLLFLAGTAPYFHDGRYASLEALLDDNLDRMGSTSQLSRDDRAALVAFLRTL
jgi:DNA-binding beta-propeller fold protein YncE